MMNINPMSMGMMGNMGGMYGMNSMSGSGVNVHEQLKARYGVGYEDFGARPYAQPYPMAITPRSPRPCVERSAILRFFNKLFK